MRFQYIVRLIVIFNFFIYSSIAQIKNDFRKTSYVLATFYKSLQPNHHGIKIIKQLTDTAAIIKQPLPFEKHKSLKKYETINDNWKWAQHYSNEILAQHREWIVKALSGSLFIESAILNKVEFAQTDNNSVFLLYVEYPQLLRLLSSDDNIIFIDLYRKPREESIINGMDYTANKVTTSHDKFSYINGEGINISVKENLFDTSDIDFKGRYFKTSQSPTTLSTHATIMATIIGGAGNSFYTGKGVAPKSNLTSTSFKNLFPENIDYYLHNNISIQNHSYGTGIENYYGAETEAYDSICSRIPYFLPVFSAGNAGNMTSITGTYKDIPNFANLTGNFKMSKNSLVIGATDSYYGIEDLSSRGPAYDGRVKPELVAFGNDGSSGAAALVSGAAALVQQSYKRMKGKLPDASLTKAVLINSADDIGNAHVDFTSGYGSLNVYRALETVKDERFFIGNISPFQTISLPLQALPNKGLLKITLCWTDPPGSINNFKGLINDLDLELINNETGEKWCPWVLNSFPHPDSLSALAQRKRDGINNVEQVSLLLARSGNYSIKLTAFSLKTTSQRFSIAYQVIDSDMFNWTFPTKNQNLIANDNNIIRWESSSKAIALIQTSTDKGETWKSVDTVKLSDGYKIIHIKDTTSLGILRMKINEDFYYSDTFTISKRLNTQVIYNCEDSVLINWNKLPGINSYQVFSLTESHFQPYRSVQDTSVILKNTSTPYFAVAPIINGRPGLLSYGFDYKIQGVGCFINGFTADLIDKKFVYLRAEIGYIQAIMSIVFQKLRRDEVTEISSFQDIKNSSYEANDDQLNVGLNLYRLKLQLNNDQEIFSDALKVYHLADANYMLFPNPLSSSESITILSGDIESALFHVYSVTGQQIFAYNLENELETIPLNILAKGLYPFLITRKGIVLAKGKLIIQ